MELNANLLLTAEKLYLERGLVRGATVNGTFALKRVGSQTYLVVDELQYRVLEQFAARKSVPEVLEACIRQRCCPALRDFYDLILKAHQAGVLRSEELAVDGPAAASRAPVRWFLALPPLLANGANVLVAAGLLAVFVLRLPVLPHNYAEALLGWAVVCAALSLGHALAASVLRGGEVEVYRPRVRRTLTPHFAVDLSEACMTSRDVRAAVHAITVLPLVAATGAGLWLGAGWSFVPLVCLLFAVRPTGGGVMRQLLVLRRRQPLLDTDRAPLFDVQMTFIEQCRRAWQRFDGRVAGLQFAYAIGWATAVGFAVYRLLHLDLKSAMLDMSVWMIALPAMAAVLVATVLWWAANVVQYDIADAVAATWRRWSIKSRRWATGKKPLADDVDIEAMIRRNPLLRRLEPDRQAELAQCMRPFSAKAWSTIQRADEEPAFVGLILSGTATMYRRLKSGRKARFLRVMEGDLFNAHKLVDPTFMALEVRTSTPFAALVIDAADFKRLVVDALGVATVRNYVHKHLFLQRGSSVCAEWRPAAVARFAELAGTAAHSAGGKIISRGEEVGNLYVLFEGRACAVQGRKSVTRIEPGDFFGEISLLQTSAATADIQSNEDSRCLVVNRLEFIRFMARNHQVALQMERLCSKRLGRPVFPLEARGV